MGPNEKKFKDIPNTIITYKKNDGYAYYLSSSRSHFEAMEIYINDIPFKKYYNGDNSAVMHPINDYILQSGTQTVRIKYISESGNPFRVDFSSSIDLMALKIGQEFSLGKSRTIYEVPKIFNDDDPLIGDFAGAGLMIFEDQFTFEAEVPYHFTSWTKSQDLTKLKPELLEKEVVTAHQNIIDILKQKDKETLYGMFYQSEFEKTQSKYYSEELFNKLSVEGFNFVLEDPSVKFHPLENYEVKIYGHGKVVTLESTTDKGESAIRFDATVTDRRTGDEFEVISNMRILLHKPEGSNTLIPIR
ncbi:hypothetical protein A8C32_16335 [Flavivirga aquatica]|uniref:Uncharacterized protein n=1 Tax=Flavivirga aquatica TaxID=1849968 RepID=A0A1E5T9G5_9FLAO|nr:hypothetical protein [Flavivirga aquatica]OEK08023.1 hypothetical protein A8C32_16335 [Flavivirga aquatica]